MSLSPRIREIHEGSLSLEQVDIWEALEALPPAQRAGLREVVPLVDITREERLLQVKITSCFFITFSAFGF
jgi:hypothetical protein